MRKLVLIAIAMFLAAGLAACSACQERVPPGHVGMVMQHDGFTGKVLKAGYHTVYGRDKLVLADVSETLSVEKMSILCRDDLNFRFNLKIRARLATTDGKGLQMLLKRMGSKISWKGDVGKLNFKLLYNVYIRPLARSVARGAVSKLETTQIRENRARIEKEIQTELVKRLKGTPVIISMVATSNFDYPDVITKAMEKKRRREIAILEEKARQQQRMIRAKNRLKMAQIQKQVWVAEAEAEAARIQIIGKATTKHYLELLRARNQEKLFQKVGVGDKLIIVPSKMQGALPMILPAGRFGKK